MRFSFLLLSLLLCRDVFCMAEDRGPSGALSVHLQIAPTPQNPRNSEGAFVTLRDGRILFVYSHFTGGKGDDAAADLVGRISSNGGETWTEPTQAVAREGTMNVMSVSLLRLADGRISLFYLLKNSKRDCRLQMRTSSDEGRTWSTPTNCMPEEGYFVVNNDRVIQLKTGRLVVPAAQHHYFATPTTKPTGRGESTCFLSDDAGKTWRRSATTLSAPAQSRAGFQEPGVVELEDGRLLMLIRTDLGYQYQSYSSDAGNTWSPAVPSALASPLSPASVKRVPGSKRLIVIWNDHRQIDPKLRNKRTPLSVAASDDDGKTWSPSVALASDPNGHYCYTAIHFVDDRILIAFAGLNGKPLRIGSFPLSFQR